MLYEVHEKDIPAMLVASITRTASAATIGKEIQEAFMTLMELVGPVGYGDGMPGTIYHGFPDAHQDGTFEIFMPVARSFEPPEGVEVKMLPAARVAFTRHYGLYETLPEAHLAIETWILDTGRSMVGPPRELYLNDPHESGEENAITEVQVPIG